MKRYRTFKRGSTFEHTILVMESDDDLLDDLILENMSSQVRSDNDDFICDLTIAETAIAGTYLVSYIDTTEWPLENLYFDIRYVLNENIYFTETIMIKWLNNKLCQKFQKVIKKIIIDI